MPGPEALAAVARELTALAASDRRAVLRALDPDERRLVADAIRRPEAAMRASAGTVLHSAWMERLLATATAGTDDGRTTTATRASLLQAAGRAPAAHPRQAGRSLLQAAGGLLGQALIR